MIITLDNGTAVNLQAITETARIAGDHDDRSSKKHGETSPILRAGNGYTGSFIVEPNDGSAYSKSLSELLALHSGVGLGDYTISYDGTIKAYECLVDVSVIGELGQLVEIRWKGTIEPEEIGD